MNDYFLFIINNFHNRCFIGTKYLCFIASIGKILLFLYYNFYMVILKHLLN